MNETAISSRDNPIFKRLKKLMESARARRDAQMSVLDGEHLLIAYLDAGGQPHTLARAASFDANTPLVVVLEDIQDPGNLGSMLRTAAAAGATLAVLSRGCHDAWSPKALRGGQGAQFVLPMRRDVELAAWLNAFSGQSIALALGEANDFYAQDYVGATALVVGNEGSGLTAAVTLNASRCAQIPMPGRVESLNASAALAVAMFEVVRQRRSGRGVAA
ncbi:MAG: tRNA methyltransferase [Hydrogenophilales bacterium 17-61-76]|nr:MAG: tRNA methyltransferase [Hydrogenophilales bacterium 17-61-76]